MRGAASHNPLFGPRKAHQLSERDQQKQLLMEAAYPLATKFFYDNLEGETIEFDFFNAFRDNSHEAAAIDDETVSKIKWVLSNKVTFKHGQYANVFGILPGKQNQYFAGYTEDMNGRTRLSMRVYTDFEKAINSFFTYNQTDIGHSGTAEKEIESKEDVKKMLDLETKTKIKAGWKNG